MQYYCCDIQQIRLKKQAEKAQAAADSSSSPAPPSPDGSPSSRDVAFPGTRKDSIAEHGVWRVVHSEKFNVPFFFDSSRNAGQFRVPPELQSLYGPQKQQQQQQPDGYHPDCTATHDSQGIVLGTYQSPGGSEEEEEECEGNAFHSHLGESDKSSPGKHSQYLCTLVDSQDQNFQSPTSPRQEATARAVLIEDTPPQDEDERGGGSAAGRPIYAAHDSSYDIAYAISQKFVSNSVNSASSPRAPSTARSDVDSSEGRSCQTQDNSEDMKEANECPFCTFINPPLALVCEICLSEMSQVTVCGMHECSVTHHSMELTISLSLCFSHKFDGVRDLKRAVLEVKVQRR